MAVEFLFFSIVLVKRGKQALVNKAAPKEMSVSWDKKTAFEVSGGKEGGTRIIIN